MEASYFYYRPSDLVWEGNNIPGHYLDKGFNVKFKYIPKNKALPELGVGLDDFAGTGFFTREYIVATKKLNYSKLSLGMGWGKFSNKNSFENPLSFLTSRLSNRPKVSDNYNLGGSPSYDQWFRGDATLFGGIEYFIPQINGLSVKLEYDPFDYLDFSAQGRGDASYKLRKKDSNFNLGLSYQLNNFSTIDASFIKGNTFNLSISIAVTFNDSLSKKPKFKPTIQVRQNKENSQRIFYEDILFNLNNNNLLLQTASLSENKLDISIAAPQHRNAIRSSLYTGMIVKEVVESNDFTISQINIAHINGGIELNNITYAASHLKKDGNTPIEIIERYTSLDSGNNNSYKNHEFKPTVKFPAIFSSIDTDIVSYIGNPEKFYFGGIDLQYISEIQFKRNLLLSSEINYALYNNFQQTVGGPASQMEHVRTEKLQYLINGDLYINRMQLDYIWSPYKNIYAKLSGGLFESMFGGVGVEMLYKPFNRNLTLGFESFYVRQRSYDQLFKFKNYKTTTAHLNIGYSLPLGIESNISYGRYLAKDDGYTFDLSRTTKSGFKAGIYFTRTDVSAERFGEGSFDKGFYIQIPMDLFSNDYDGGSRSFKLSPLTRDGGAKLQYDKDLKGMMSNTTLRELKHGWRTY